MPERGVAMLPPATGYPAGPLRINLSGSPIWCLTGRGYSCIVSYGMNDTTQGASDMNQNTMDHRTAAWVMDLLETHDGDEERVAKKLRDFGVAGLRACRKLVNQAKALCEED